MSTISQNTQMKSLDAGRIDLLPRAKLIELTKILDEIDRRKRQNYISTLFPDNGPLARSGYKKHLEFFEQGKKYRERLFIAANRTGKTVVGAFETSVHLTGLYPNWWPGRRFDGPVRWWVAGDTGETVRDIIQLELFGPIDDIGTGLIPGKQIIGSPTRRSGVPDAIQSARIRHISGGVSTIGLKSYDQKRKSFQGTGRHGIWLDEECDMGIYTECLLRTMTTNGLMILTFTPLKGISDVVKAFLPGGKLKND